MANSGTLTGISANSSTNGGKYTIAFDWIIIDQSLEDNTTTIQWMLQVYNTTSKSVTANFANVSINGVNQAYNTSKSVGANSHVVFCDGTKEIPHNADGTKTFRVEINAAVGASGINAIGWDNFDLDAITIAKITSLTDVFTDDGNPTIYYSNPLGEYVESIEACISFTGGNDDIPYREISRTGTSYTFNLTDDERDTLRSLLYDGTSGIVRFYIRTTDGSYRNWDYKNATVRFTNYMPTSSPTVTDGNDVTYALTGSRNKLIRYYSEAEYSINGEGKKGAYIVTQYARNGETTLEYESGTFTNVTSNTFYFSVTDNRGYTTNNFVVFNDGNFIEYVKPTCHIKVTIPEAGKSTLTISGVCFNGSFGAKNNNLQFQYTIRENDGIASTYSISTTPTFDGNNYSLTYTITGLNQSSKYTIGAIVKDSLAEAHSETRSVGAISVFDWSKDDFQHNTDVVLANDKALNGVKPDGTWVKALEPCNADGDTVINKTSYDLGEGNTKIYGNGVEINTNEPLKINGREYGANNVLWEGSYFMMDTQSVDLTDNPISSQPNGIVLVFSLYRNDAAADVSINTFFISKKEVELLPGAPHTFMMAINNNMSVFGAKYLRISDTHIDGDASNTSTGTAAGSGITFNNNQFVLRYVIGV